MSRRVAVVLLGILACVVGAIFVPPIAQDPAYHNFAEQRTILGVSNFWNVVSNLPFVAVAVIGMRKLSRSGAERDWQYIANWIFMVGTLLIAIGSGYYHYHPTTETLFWDRLPMTVGFMALFAVIIGQRIDDRIGRSLLIPLLLAGLASVSYWRFTGDLRPYVLIQFVPMLTIPLILWLHPSRVNLWPVIGWYAVAKILEMFDQPMARIVSTGGHPWKHVAAALAVYAYVRAAVDRPRTLQGTV